MRLENGGVRVPQDLLDDGAKVRQIRLVGDRRESFRPDDLVDLFLRFPLNIVDEMRSDSVKTYLDVRVLRQTQHRPTK